MKYRIKTNLRHWRRGFGLKQKELGRLMGRKSVTFVSRLENGERYPNLETAIACEILTGESIRFLFPSVYVDIEGKTKKQVEKFLQNIEASTSNENLRKQELFRDILERISNKIYVQ